MFIVPSIPMVFERNFLDRTEHCSKHSNPCSKGTWDDAQLVVYRADAFVGVRLCTTSGRTVHPWLVSEFISTRSRRGRAHFGHSGECNIVRGNAPIRQCFIVEKCGDCRGGVPERIDLWTCSGSVKQLISRRYHALRLQCLGLAHRTTDLVLHSQKVISTRRVVGEIRRLHVLRNWPDGSLNVIETLQTVTTQTHFRFVAGRCSASSSRTASSCSGVSARFGTILNVTGDEYKRKWFFPSKYPILFFHSKSAAPPFHRQCRPAGSNKSVIGPCAEGCFKDKLRANHHGDAHINIPQRNASPNRGATLE